MRAWTHWLDAHPAHSDAHRQMYRPVLLSVALGLLAPAAVTAFLSRGNVATPASGARTAARRGTLSMKAGWALLFDCDGVLADTERDGRSLPVLYVVGGGLSLPAATDASCASPSLLLRPPPGLQPGLPAEGHQVRLGRGALWGAPQDWRREGAHDGALEQSRLASGVGNGVCVCVCPRACMHAAKRACRRLRYGLFPPNHA